MNMKFAKAVVVAAVSMSAMMAFTACDETTAGAQGVAGVQGEPGADGKNGKDGRDGADGRDGKNGKDGTSCTATKLSDGSGFELSCDDEVVGVIKNGKDGNPGEDGASCTVEGVTDEESGKTGYKLTCGETPMGIVWNGEKGDAGESCTVADTTDSETERTGYKLLCGNKLKGVVWNGEKGDKGDPGDPGEAGESCTVKAVTGGYDVYCGGVKKGTLKNGESGTVTNLSDVFDLDYYNRLLLGQKGSGFFWKASDGHTATVNGSGSAYWNYWTDADEDIPGNSGFSWAIKGIIDSKTWDDFDDELIESVGGVGGTIVLKKNEKLGWNLVEVQLVCENEKACFDPSKMLGLCVEYISEFVSTQVRIHYENEKNNGYARPYINIPASSKKRVVNLPWAAFNKTPEWASVEVGVADAIKAMNGLDVLVSSNNTNQVGDLIVYKVGAYGTCE